MNNQDYETKKCECWEEAIQGYSYNPKVLGLMRKVFDFAFDRAYALGKQEQDAATVTRGWAARDSNSDLFIYNDKPKRDTRWDGIGIWYGEYITELASNLFPDLTWNDDPQEVEIIIKRKKNG